jgi:ribose-phosphate pyrophosphokinase
MMPPILFALPGNEPMARTLADQAGLTLGTVELHRFPDGESLVRLQTPVAAHDVVFVCTLDRPDTKVLPLLFAAATARELGARRVGLVAPYLAYMRQDRSFRASEGVTSSYFARMLSAAFDWLVTVDPHLHRRHSLSEIYSMPSRVLHAAPVVARWIATQVPDAVLIGPDEESEQWVGAVAAAAGVPHTVLAKQRRGDRDVRVSSLNLSPWSDRTPLLLDDIVSTGRTMIRTIEQLRRSGARRPVCVAVHAVFAGDAYGELRGAGAGHIASCNTIVHESNAIDVSRLLAEGLAGMLVPSAAAPRVHPAPALVSG